MVTDDRLATIGRLANVIELASKKRYEDEIRARVRIEEDERAKIEAERKDERSQEMAKGCVQFVAWLCFVALIKWLYGYFF